MRMQWHLRNYHRGNRPLKKLLGRCKLFFALSAAMLLLYATVRAERGISVVPSFIQARNWKETRPVSEESETPIPDPSSELVDGGTPSASFHVDRDIEIAPASVVDPDTSGDPVASLADPDTSGGLAASLVDPEAGEASASAKTRATSGDGCDGRRIFVYEMPAEFNEELARDCHNWKGWPSMCEDITNHGFGEVQEPDASASVLQPPNSWYRTDQFNLEVIMHERLKAYPCLTTNPDVASMFYIPFYHTLDLIRNLYNWDDISLRDRLGHKFAAWLAAQEPWRRHRGHRHVLVLGRIYWDFCRSAGTNDLWGSDLVTRVELTNVTKLLIERNPWKDDTIAIPYPTSFHPSSDAGLVAWQAHVRAAERHQLASVAGGARAKKLTGGIRDAVFDQCANSTQCHLLVCTHALCVGNPATIIRMGLESVFCLQPPGDSPTRKGIFDSLQAGCIPVLFNKYQAELQYLLHLPGNASDYSVVIPEDAVLTRQYDVMRHLSSIPHHDIVRMRDSIVQLLPRLLYRNPSPTGEYTAQDAFDVAVDALLERFQEGESHPRSL